MHAAIFHRGKDDRVRQLCGPRINSVINRPKINCVVHALHSRDMINKLMHGCIVRTDLDYKIPGRWEGLNQQLKSHKLIDLQQRRRPEIKREPLRDKVEPKFRTPPDWIRVGSIDLSLHGKGIMLHAC